MECKERYEKNQKLVSFFFRKYKSSLVSYQDFDDLLQELRISLWKSCLSFQEGRGKFASYALNRMQQTQLWFLRERRSKKAQFYNTLLSFQYTYEELQLEELIPGEVEMEDETLCRIIFHSIQLKPTEKELIQLTLKHDDEEIAAMQNVLPNAIWKRKKKIIQKLKQEWCS